jgi:hypothetical protein
VVHLVPLQGMRIAAIGILSYSPHGDACGEGASMIACPLCGAKTFVVETRASSSGTRRRRDCTVSGCKGKVTTVEVVIPEGRILWLAKGFVLVSGRKLAELKKIIAALEGSPL